MGAIAILILQKRKQQIEVKNLAFIHKISGRKIPGWPLSFYPPGTHNLQVPTLQWEQDCARLSLTK